MKTTKHLMWLVALLALPFVTGCGSLRWADAAEPATGWTDLKLAKMTPGTCQAKAYAYCQRLERQQVRASVMVVALANGQLHAVVTWRDAAGRKVVADPTTGEVCYGENYEEGAVVSTALYALR